MKYYLLILAAGLWAPVYGQQTSADTTGLLEEVIVTANKFPENKKYVAQQTIVIGNKEIAGSLSNNTAGLLEQSGKVFVQRSQLGGGSPVIKGFEASRIVLVVDGVRMNNAIYRTGHLQNVITIDDDILEKVEIYSGPASTIYGSDALGGVIYFQTKQPELGQLRTQVSSRYSSAMKEFTGHVDVNVGTRRFASLTSFSYSNYGDLRQGSHRRKEYGELGLRRQYITPINGIDSIIQNDNVNLQKFSNYRQYDLLQKFLWQPQTGQSHELNWQYSNSNDIPRYDRLTDVRNGKLRWAEWYYGPQERLMASYQFNTQHLQGFFDQLRTGASYQHIEESRMQRAYRNPLRENRIEKIDVWALNLDLHKTAGNHDLSVGADGQFNFLRSTAFNYNVASGAKTTGITTRYPDGKNNMNYAGIYAQHAYRIVPGKLILNDGIRFNYSSLDANFKDTSLLHLPYTKATQRHLTYSVNAGLIWLPDAGSRISLNVSTGFRSPNIDDLAKVFESAGGVQLVVPNPDLKPEHTWQFDLDLSKRWGKWLELEANAFYTIFRDAVVMDRFTLNGASSILYDGKMTPVVANQNKAKASLYGVQGAVSLRPAPWLNLYSHLTFTHGRYEQAGKAEVPLDHIPPVFGKTGIKAGYKILEAEVYMLYNGKKELKDYNPYGEDNLQYATPEGMPAWQILNIAASLHLPGQWTLQCAVENLFDQHYRVFASGISGAGRNLVVKVKKSFGDPEPKRRRTEP
ncbi:TonB-dependent receptor [Paraflavitalea sp. CAU 1676]|uniref:TonB-dependent receptor n=1 Tax=Paraflavitalea sp. CAU 1676 TaxID=3032598 RepID=UPI0023DAEB88|nr:TonB-dependent receptor [Paraflavitalea sp. CAU 1676]MDF2188401.1 TonB-dependent receptor [Paraflavitalea sp. CAU 1676]